MLTKILWFKYFVNFLFFWKRQTCNVTDGTLIGRRRSASLNTTSYCKKELCNKGNYKNHITGNRLHTIQENVALGTSLRIIHRILSTTRQKWHSLSMRFNHMTVSGCPPPLLKNQLYPCLGYLNIFYLTVVSKMRLK